MAIEEELAGDLIAPGGRLVLKHSGTLLGAVWTGFVGKDLFLYGPSGAGKTSFIKYMVTSARANPSEDRELTRRKRNRYFSAFRISGNSDQTVDIRRLRDRPGNSSGEIHGVEFTRERPHHAVVLLDATLPFSSKNGDSISKYLTDFWGELRRGNKELSKKVYRVWIIVNKIDQIKSSKTERLMTKINKLLGDLTIGVILTGRVKLRPCSLVEGPEWEAVSDRLLNDILADMVYP